MRIELFDYELPEELIAQQPAARRDASRLLVVDRGAADPMERSFADLAELLRAGDLLVLNDAFVDAVRLHTRRDSGGAVEVLLLRRSTSPQREDSTAAGEGSDAIHDAPADSRKGGELWQALVRPGRRARAGERLALDDDGPYLVVRGETPEGRRVIELPAGIAAAELFDRWGQMPLPPYIARSDHDARAPLDRERYQTVYARAHGAVAAPTAGLHFSEELLARLDDAGIARTTLTLAVGPGTFQPVRVNEVTEHRMEAESYALPQTCVDAIVATRAGGGRVIGVGTTVVRTLEHAARANGRIEDAAGQGAADIFIYPGFEFGVVDAMLTNFHLPRSTPILMASAMAGRERLLRAYELAVRERFRFYSYGDAMLIL